MRLGGRREDVSPGVKAINTIRRSFLEIVSGRFVLCHILSRDECYSLQMVEDQPSGLLVIVLRVCQSRLSAFRRESYRVPIHRRICLNNFVKPGMEVPVENGE